jgi:hypothetical protein
MTLTVAKRLIQDATSLSPLGRMTLGFIDGGTEWLAWAVAHTASRYDVADETVLMAEVQHGLHASRFTLLPRLQLMVSPVKLMTLGFANLRTLARAESGNTSSVVEAQVRRILADHGLLTQADLAAGTSFLVELGVAGAPVFQAMGFHERMAIYGLLHLGEGPDAYTPALRREAASFSVQQARTPQEFCDYYQLYLQPLANGTAAADATQRDAQATRTMQALLPLLFGALDCPQVGELASPDQVSRTVGQWLASGKQIGFARLSQGVQQVVRHSAYKNETGEAARRVLELYLQAARSFVASTRPQRPRMGQDGASSTFTLDAGNQQALLHVDAAGVVSLSGFARKPSTPPAATAPDAGTDTNTDRDTHDDQAGPDTDLDMEAAS